MNKVYELVQERIVKDIEKAIEEGKSNPWIKPWNTLGAPRNFITKKPYKGINLLLLDKGGYYLTFNQIKSLQKEYDFIKLKKGSKSDIIVFWKFNDNVKDTKNTENDKDSLEQDENKKNIPILKYYNVFHQSNIEGFEQLVPDQEVYNHEESILDAEEIINNYSKVVNIEFENIDKAYYSPSIDKIVVPGKEYFKIIDAFYSTCFHEIIHSTGNEKRLNRLSKSFKFGDDKYSKEELVAEIGASMLCADCKINNNELIKNSNAYLYGWLTAIKEDVKLVISASQQAQKACDFVMNFIKGEENEETE